MTFLFDNITLWGFDTKPLTVTISLLLGAFFIYSLKNKRWYTRLLVSFALVIASLMHYEIFWNAVNLIAVQPWKFTYGFFDVISFTSANVVLMYLVRGLYGITFNMRAYAVVSALFLAGSLGLMGVGFYRLWYNFDMGLSTMNPHLYYPNNAVWLLSKLPVLGWTKVFGGTKR